jgi:hypothetical protein
MKILIDSREQLPFAFSGKSFEDVTTEAGSLPTGDYSLAGLTDLVAVERKSLDDLAQCLGRERDRFERELVRARGLDAFAVVVEGSFEDLAHGRYKSKLNPHAACQSVLSFSARLGIPFFFAGSRAGAEYATAGFLRQYLQGCRARLKAIEKATESGAQVARDEC